MRAQANAWNPNDRSLNMFVRNDDKFTLHRHPVAQSTDGVRGKRGYSRGVHVWEFTWYVLLSIMTSLIEDAPLSCRPAHQRGTHAVVGVGTKDAPLNKVGYCALVGDDEHSWGWDIGRNRLMHNGKRMAIDIGNRPTMPYSAPPAAHFTQV